MISSTIAAPRRCALTRASLAVRFAHAAHTTALALAALASLALAAPALAATTPSDAWLTTKVKVSLATTDGVDVTEVHVDTIRREVTLHGTVNTPGEKSTAERAAGAVAGVRSVRNLLQVVASRNEVAVEARDDVVRDRVSAALAADASLNDSSISVQSVNKGLVLLKGRAASLSDLLTAIEITRGVEGTRRVASEVQSEDTLVEADIWKERNIAVGGAAAPAAPGAASDLYTTSMVKIALLANRETPAMEINVDTRAGVVTLFGLVPTAESRAAAEAEAGTVNGVLSVKNQLQVVAAAKQAAVEAKDELVQGDVRKNLAGNTGLGHVRCEVKNCVARLTGGVPSGVERVEAMQIARSTKGVCSVKDDLVIE